MKKLRSASAKARAFISDYALDALALAGIACLSAGAALIYPPAGLIVLGALLVATAIGAER